MVYNELLRSAYQIAQRKGKDTNWDAFELNVQRELLMQAGYLDVLEETITGQTFIEQERKLRATCTAKTYYLKEDI